jgi:hypothetical protein
MSRSPLETCHEVAERLDAIRADRFRDTSRAVITLVHALFGLALTLTTWRALMQDWPDQFGDPAVASVLRLLVRAELGKTFLFLQVVHGSCTALSLGVRAPERGLAGSTLP